MSRFTPDQAVEALRTPGRTLSEHDCYHIARCIGKLNRQLAAALQRPLLEELATTPRVWVPMPGETEFITWIYVSERLPDAELTVNIATPYLDEPTWLGFHDGDSWYAVDGRRLEDGDVVAWSPMLVGVAAPAAAKQRGGASA